MGGLSDLYIDMDINELKDLINHIKELPGPELPEPTLFSIGGRGYYENPTSDVLAFFCNSEGVHGLGNLVMNALFAALTKLDIDSFPFDDFSLITEPEREVTTKNGKRLDLLLEGNEWVMVIENKIYHQQNNPFKTYQRHIQGCKQFHGKTPIYVVLSPKGGAPEGWLSLSYPLLLDSLKENLAQAFMSQPLNKWLVLLREFILHMEGIMFGPTIPQETMDYVLANLSEIKQAQDLKQKTVNVFQHELLQVLQSAFPCEKISTKLHHWYGYPAIRFYFESWETKSDVVLFLDGRKDKVFCVNYYACDIANQKQRDLADASLKEDDCSKPWNELSEKNRCYKVRFETFDKSIATRRLIHKLSILDEFETKIRSQW
jgi:hypothetical protein